MMKINIAMYVYVYSDSVGSLGYEIRSASLKVGLGRISSYEKVGIVRTRCQYDPWLIVVYLCGKAANRIAISNTVVESG